MLTRFSKLLFTAAGFSLAACGGGGGGGSAAPSDPNHVAIPSTFQGANTTTAYGAASAAGSFSDTTGITGSGIAAADTGSTVTVTTDGNDHLSSLAINVTNGGSTFSATYAGTQFVSLSGPITLAELASGIELVANASAGTTGIVFQGVNQNLSYSAFGAWLSNDGGGNFRVGNLAAGVETVTMPIVGTATYSGTTIGVGATGTSAFAFTGGATIGANFATNVVTTTFSGLTTQNLITNALGILPDQTGTGTITGNKYATSITGGGLAGTANGTFYGPAAQESAGVWRSTGGGTTVVGSFGAHQ